MRTMSDSVPCPYCGAPPPRRAETRGEAHCSAYHRERHGGASAAPLMVERGPDDWVARWAYLGGASMVAFAALMLAVSGGGLSAEGDAATLAVFLCGVAALVFTAVLRGRARGIVLLAAILITGVIVVRTVPTYDPASAWPLHVLLLLSAWSAVTIAAGSHLQRDAPRSIAPRVLTGFGGATLAALIAVGALPAYFDNYVWLRGHPPIAPTLPFVLGALVYAGLGVACALWRGNPYWICERISAWGRALVLALPIGVIILLVLRGPLPLRGAEVLVPPLALVGPCGYVVVLGAGLVGLFHAPRDESGPGVGHRAQRE